MSKITNNADDGSTYRKEDIKQWSLSIPESEGVTDEDIKKWAISVAEDEEISKEDTSKRKYTKTIASEIRLSSRNSKDRSCKQPLPVATLDKESLDALSIRSHSLEIELIDVGSNIFWFSRKNVWIRKQRAPIIFKAENKDCHRRTILIQQSYRDGNYKTLVDCRIYPRSICEFNVGDLVDKNPIRIVIKCYFNNMMESFTIMTVSEKEFEEKRAIL